MNSLSLFVIRVATFLTVLPAVGLISPIGFTPAVGTAFLMTIFGWLSLYCGVKLYDACAHKMSPSSELCARFVLGWLGFWLTPRSQLVVAPVTLIDWVKGGVMFLVFETFALALISLTGPSFLTFSSLKGVAAAGVVLFVVSRLPALSLSLIGAVRRR